MPTATGKTAKTEPATPEDLEADIAQLKADIAQLADQLKKTGSHSYGAARRAAVAGGEQIRAQGEATVESLRATANDFESQIASAVREKPLTALGIAAGVGYLFALMSRR